MFLSTFVELVVVDVTANLIHAQSKYLIVLFLDEMLLLLFSDVFGPRFGPLDLLIIDLRDAFLLRRHDVRGSHSLMALGILGEGHMLRLDINNV